MTTVNIPRWTFSSLMLTTLMAIGSLFPLDGYCGPYQDEKETLVFWSSFGAGKPKVAMDKFVREFNSTHGELGHVKTLGLEFNQLQQKLLTAVALFTVSKNGTVRDRGLR